MLINGKSTEIIGPQKCGQRNLKQSNSWIRSDSNIKASVVYHKYKHMFQVSFSLLTFYSVTYSLLLTAAFALIQLPNDLFLHHIFAGFFSIADFFIVVHGQSIVKIQCCKLVSVRIVFLTNLDRRICHSFTAAVVDFDRIFAVGLCSWQSERAIIN